MSKILGKILPVIVVALMMAAWVASPYQSVTAATKTASKSAKTKKSTVTVGIPGTGGIGTPSPSSTSTTPGIGVNVTGGLDLSNVSPSDMAGTLQLSGLFAGIPNAQQNADAIAAFSMKMSGLSRKSSSADKEFIKDSLTSNTLELETLLYAVGRVSNADLKNLIQVMIAHHMKDQNTIIALAQRMGVSTDVDLTNASTTKGSPSYDLGIRTENLTDEYLTPLQGSGTSFDTLALDIMEQEHSADIEGEMTWERMVKSPQLKPFVFHSADVTDFHMELMDAFHNLAIDNIQSTPDFQTSLSGPGSKGGSKASATPSVTSPASSTTP